MVKLGKKYGKRVTAVTVFILLALFVFAPSVGAQGLGVYGEEVPAGETVENDVFLNGDDVRVEGTVDGDVFAFGNNITINGDISGSLFAIGDKVQINGTVEGSAYVIAVSLQMLAESSISHSLYFAGVSLQTEQGSQIGRDINGVSLGANVRSTVGRDTNLVIGLVEIGRLVMQKFNELNTGKESVWLPMPDGEVTATSLRVIPAGVAGNRTDLQVHMAQVSTTTINSWVTRFFQGLVSFLIVGGLALWLTPRPFVSWAEQVRRRPLPSFGWGIVAYIVGFVATLILLLLAVAIGLSLNFVSLSPLAFTWLGLSLSALGLGFWTFILFLAFMSKAIVGYVVGLLILQRVYPKAAAKPLWPLLLGLVFYSLICLIPYLGWAVGFIVTCLGLGAVWQVVQTGRRGSGGETAVSTAAIT